MDPQTDDKSQQAGPERPATRPAGGRTRQRVEVLPDAADLARVAAELISAAALISIAQRGAFRIALSGGSTPRPTYAHLADDPDINWQQWHIFWSDERCVPPSDSRSNFLMVRETMLDRLSMPPGLVVRMPGELSPAEAAITYERNLRELVPAGARGRAALPRFDMVLLGMGADGHTASLFPHSEALAETTRLVVANAVPHMDEVRLTFTYPLINAAQRVLVLVSGADKAETLHQVLSGPHDPQRLPIQRVAPQDGQITWLVDQEAFALIEALTPSGQTG